MQISFTRFKPGLSDGFTDQMAKKERDLAYYKLRKAGVKSKRWVLTNQLRKYSGFGQPDGSIYDAYYLTVYEPEKIPRDLCAELGICFAGEMR